MKYAVIDIGSNSVRLLLWADGRSLYKKINTTRLGEGLALSPILRKDAMERTAAAVGMYADEAKSEGAENIFVFATAAVRGAKNGNEFVSKIFREYGLTVDVVSGEREAVLGLTGALEGRDGGIIDVGGASSEITVGKEGRVIYAVSADVGAVRLKDACGEDRGRLEEYIAERIAAYGEVPVCNMTAVGGTATSLAALEYAVEPYDPAAIHGAPLDAERIFYWADTLLSMPLSERLLLKGMDKRRADVLGGGALLLYRILRYIGAKKLTVSEKDNLEGYLRFVTEGKDL